MFRNLRSSPSSGGLLGPNTSLWLAGAAASLPIAYVALTETYRLYVLRRRQSLYSAYLEGRLPPFISVGDVITHRFASLKCWLTGRYLNVTFEWREQTIYEFIFHHLVYRPLVGKVWWQGGLSEDLAEREASLPSEEVDTELLLRRSWRSKSQDKLSGKGKGKGKAAIEEGSGSEEEWEKLETSRAGLVPATSSELEASSLDGKNKDNHDDDDSMTYTWLGQSTSIVQLGGVTLLTDPVFAAQPLASILAPTRLRPTPISTQDLLALNILDIILISHNHFDHLDKDFVISAVQSGIEATWVIPLGIRQFMMNLGVREEKIVEMDWWQEEIITIPNGGKKVKVACTPAQHWSGRTPMDTNRSLWCGFVVREVAEDDKEKKGEGRSFFHAGDTGYSSDLYKAIGKLHAPITLAAIPIGSFEPRHFMKNVHTDPQGAVNIHRDLGIKKSIGVHWGTWIMSDERFDDPVKELRKVIETTSYVGPNAVTSDDFVVLPTGRTITI